MTEAQPAMSDHAKAKLTALRRMLNAPYWPADPPRWPAGRAQRAPNRRKGERTR
jgi:hypothetical protein